jgi:hypothetical protein
MHPIHKALFETYRQWSEKTQEEAGADDYKDRGRSVRRLLNEQECASRAVLDKHATGLSGTTADGYHFRLTADDLILGPTANAWFILRVYERYARSRDVDSAMTELAAFVHPNASWTCDCDADGTIPFAGEHGTREYLTLLYKALDEPRYGKDLFVNAEANNAFANGTLEFSDITTKGRTSVSFANTFRFSSDLKLTHYKNVYNTSVVAKHIHSY